ncbi:hypothetical protein ACFU7Y_24000 [Kitasatospora sp. NPDC057542]|uniref:hypothetical protein n=1 Tax=Kitasatospora sp. NPDC057542 TaxID=3346162 RepID=UPI0036739272
MLVGVIALDVYVNSFLAGVVGLVYPVIVLYAFAVRRDAGSNPRFRKSMVAWGLRGDVVTVRIDPAVVADVEDCVEDASGGSWHAIECSAAAVRWAALRGASGPVLPPLPDPFEPLIRLYERGGAGFSYANGFLDFGMLMVERGNPRTHLSPEPFVELDDAALDALDERSWTEFHALAERAGQSTGNG